MREVFNDNLQGNTLISSFVLHRRAADESPKQMLNLSPKSAV
jgi:hypothetical protein